MTTFKTALILLMMSAMSTSVVAQEKIDLNAQNHSMLDGNPEWVYCCYNYGYVWKYYGLTFFRYYVDRDYQNTESGEWYKMLCMEMYTEKGELIDVDSVYCYDDETDGKRKIVVALLQEKDGIITGNTLGQQDYCYYGTSPDKRFIYDFNMKTGDEYYVNYMHRNMLHKHSVKNRSKIILADGSERDLITISGIESYNPGYAKSWKKFPGFYDIEVIDGIGSINSVGQLLMPHYYYGLEYAGFMNYNDPEPSCARLNMFRQNGEIVYLAPETDPESEVGEYYTTFKSMPFYPEVTPTAIKDIIAEKQVKGNSGIYNLGGQKLSGLEKGINIINGQKVIITK